MPSTYEMISDVFWPLHLCAAIVVAYLIHEWTDIFRFPGDDDPDGWA